MIDFKPTEVGIALVLPPLLSLWLKRKKLSVDGHDLFFLLFG